MSKETIIVVEDNDTMRLGIVESLSREGYIVRSFANGTDALEDFKKKRTDIAVVDLRMEPINGIDVLKQLKDIYPLIEVLIVSAFGTVEDAVEAMRLGAADFLTKPFSPTELRIRVKKIEEKITSCKKLEKLIEQNKLLNDDLFTGYDSIIGSSKSIQEVFNIVDQVASNDSTVLIYGESGTGKELIAKALHKKSNRTDMPFIKINCGALNENLLESELFGHEKGSFTGAIKQKKGRFELADNGTLFLDEIGDISLQMQVKLLRVLQEGEFERVGGEETITSNVRIIAATNKNLEKLIAEDKFREDLFYRLSIIPITLPPLRERKGDIVLLAEYFLDSCARKFNKPIKKIDAEAVNLMLNYSWPGNIRELENLMERLFLISKGEIIELELVLRHLSNKASTGNDLTKLPLEEAVYAFEKNLIIQAMKKADGVKNRAAKILGVNTSALYYKLEKFELL